MRVYDLAGMERPFLDVGRLNNVDLVTAALPGYPDGLCAGPCP